MDNGKPMLYLVVGMKGIGKTKLTIDILREYRDRQPRGRKSLIVDRQNEFSDPALYPDIRTLPYNQVGLFSKHPEISIRRIPPFRLDTGQAMTPDEACVVVIHILNYFRDACLVLEDINEYIYDYMPTDIVGKILSQRHTGLDIIMHFHSLGAIQHKIWRFVNVIRMHKCEDSVIGNKDKFIEKYELFKIAENIVNDQFEQDNQYFSCEILMAQRKIIAQITDADRDKAMADYINLHYNKLIKPYLTRRGQNREREYSEETAFEAEMKRLRATYFLTK